MSRPLRLAAALAAGLALGGCAGLISPTVDAEAERAGAAPSPLDSANLGDIMLSVAGADEAVAYFRDALAANPADANLRRGYARALSRNRQYAEARFVYRDLEERGQAEAADRVDYALVLARLALWDEAEGQLALLPPGADTARLALARALLADHRGDWAQADAAYARARDLAAQPSGALNNWGVSKLARRDFAGAERAFEDALTYDPGLFSAKNNLTIAYGLQRRYRLPLVSLTEEERAILLHNLGVIALRRGDREVGRDLLRQSLAAHPQFYAPAADKLAALDGPAG